VSAIRSPRRLLTALLVAVALVAGGACGGSPTGSPSAVPSTGSGDLPSHARLVATRQVSGRMWDLIIDSPAVGAQVKVRLLLPPGFAAAPTRRWPVLYLLHGCCDTYVSWTRSTDVERLTRHAAMLVVMPDGGPVGFYSDWQSGPGWETFHLSELGEILASRYRASNRRAIAGVSMGGLGALDYAARHPGSFSVAASFSGIVDTRLSSEESQAYLDLVQSQGEDPLDLWGDPTTDAAVWQAHNPNDLAPRLARTTLFVSAGDGGPGPLDPPGASRDPTEGAIAAENAEFVEHIRALGLDAHVDLYGPGTHSWVYWQRELHRAWPLITRGLGLT
jgi:diacylglycerol O-acyltransferase/trehalose O-mycolyltransferase